MNINISSYALLALNRYRRLRAKGQVPRLLHRTLLEDIWGLLERLQDFKLVHVYRKGNQVADVLASYGVELGSSSSSSLNSSRMVSDDLLCCTWATTPSCLLSSLAQDGHRLVPCLVSD